MLSVTRLFTFDAAHRVLRHESSCKFLHGHRYEAHVTIRGPKLDDLGRVIDFGTLKDLCKKWIDDTWDHNILLNMNDPLLKLPKEQYESVFGGRNPYQIGRNPTVEVLAEVMLGNLDKIIRAYDPQLCVSRIKLYETANCYTIFRNPLL